MKYMVEKPLKDFEFWSGARDTADRLNDEQFALVEQLLEQEQDERIAGGGRYLYGTALYMYEVAVDQVMPVHRTFNCNSFKPTFHIPW